MSIRHFVCAGMICCCCCVVFFVVEFIFVLWFVFSSPHSISPFSLIERNWTWTFTLNWKWYLASFRRSFALKVTVEKRKEKSKSLVNKMPKRQEYRIFSIEIELWPRVVPVLFWNWKSLLPIWPATISDILVISH